MRDIYSDYVHAIRFALEGKPQEASLLAKRSFKFSVKNKSRAGSCGDQSIGSI